MNVRLALLIGALVGFVVGRYKIYRVPEIKFHSAGKANGHHDFCQCAECYMNYGS